MNQTRKRITLLVVCVFLSTCLPSCVYDYTWFRPADTKTPIVLFDCYSATFRGWAAGRHQLICNLEFSRTVTDTTLLDTIPILILDSICFSGECLDDAFCVKPASWHEQDQRRFRHGRGHYRRESDLVREHDLYYIDGRLVPGGFDLWDDYRLPDICNKDDVSVTLKAVSYTHLTLPTN